MPLSYKLFVSLSIFFVALMACQQHDRAESNPTTHPTSISQNPKELVLDTPIQTPLPTPTQTSDLTSFDLSETKSRFLTLQIAPESQAAYTIKEELLGVGFPTDVLGVTKDVTGKIVLDQNSNISGNDSMIEVDLRTLETGEEQRDKYVRRNTLETSVYPFARYIPTTVSNLPSPLPTDGTLSFSIDGEMTIHGVTKDLVWNVKATFSDGEVLAWATTEFQLVTFDLIKPRVRRVLSVEDQMRLQVDLHLIVTDR